MNSATLFSLKTMLFLSLFSITTDTTCMYSIQNYKLNAKVEARFKKQAIKMHYETLLRTAAQNNNTEELNHLLSRGVNVNAQSDSSAESALHWAAKNGSVDAVKILLDKKEINVNIQNSKRITPLYNALDSIIKEDKNLENFVTIITLLLDNNAQIIFGTKHLDTGFALEIAGTPPNEQDIDIYKEISNICSNQNENCFLDIVYLNIKNSSDKDTNKEKRKYLNRAHNLLLSARLENPDICGKKNITDLYKQAASEQKTTAITNPNQFYYYHRY